MDWLNHHFERQIVWYDKGASNPILCRSHPRWTGSARDLCQSPSSLIKGKICIRSLILDFKRKQALLWTVDVRQDFESCPRSGYVWGRRWRQIGLSREKLAPGQRPFRVLTRGQSRWNQKDGHSDVALKAKWLPDDSRVLSWARKKVLEWEQTQGSQVPTWDNVRAESGHYG